MALILSRRPGESIQIGDDVLVKILGFKGNQVRLSITAPRNISVDRSELRIRKDAEKGTP